MRVNYRGRISTTNVRNTTITAASFLYNVILVYFWIIYDITLKKSIVNHHLINLLESIYQSKYWSIIKQQ